MILVRDSVNDVIDVFEELYKIHREKVSNLSTTTEHFAGSFRKKSFKHVDKIPRMAGKQHKTYIESFEDTKKKISETKIRWSDSCDSNKKSMKRHKQIETPPSRPRRNAIVTPQYMELTSNTQTATTYNNIDNREYVNDVNGNLTKRCLSQEMPTYKTVDSVDALEQFVHRRVALKETVT